MHYSYSVIDIMPCGMVIMSKERCYSSSFTISVRWALSQEIVKEELCHLSTSK